jgi:two-component system, cell cycle response regulator DivK
MNTCLAPSGRPWRILVVDDDDAVRGCTRLLLTRAGFDSQEAPSASTGIDEARSWHPDLILMDLRMQGTSGADAIELVRADPVLRSITTVAYSGFIPLFGEDELRGLGFDALIAKPLSAGELVECVLSILSSDPPPLLNAA